MKSRILHTIYSVFVFSTLVLLFFVNADCKDEPPTKDNNNTLIDTTSHNFTVIRIDTLGGLFSFANGVDIVDENNIWVAGIFTEKDTDGTTLYNKNLAHWDGEKWNYFSIQMYGWNNTGPSPEELGAVKVFNDSLIFVVAKQDNSVAWWNGEKWTSNYINDAVVSPHFWARSSNDIYFVASEGRATYYDGKTYTKINTGLTNPPLLDVWGDDDAVYAVGYGTGTIEGTETVFLSGNGLSWGLYAKLALNANINAMGSIYRQSKKSKLWVLGGSGYWKIFEIESLSPFTMKQKYELVDYYAQSIRGTADNDIYVSSSINGEFYHYNGDTWKKIESNVDLFTFQFAVKKNVWVMCGSLRNGVGTGILVVGKHLK